MELITLNNIKETYNNETYLTVKEFMKNTNKLISQKNRRIFLLHCKTNSLNPTFMNFNFRHISFQRNYLERKFISQVSRFKYSLFNLLITDCTLEIKSLQQKLKILHQTLISTTSPEILIQFLNQFHTKIEYKFQTMMHKQQSKVKRLKQQKTHDTTTPTTNNNIKNWVQNISNTVIPHEVKEILCLGPNFSLNINKNQLPIPTLIANIETAIENKPNNQKNEIRSKINNIIYNFKNKPSKVNKENQNLEKKVKKTKQFIKENPQITILKSDKSNKTVIMDTTQYNNKITNMLNDTTTYKKIKNNPTKTFQTENNNLIKKWEHLKYISKETSYELKINNALAPKFYGLPKLHKPGIPLRPIVSYIQSPFYNLSKYLSNILSKVIKKTQYYIKDSWTFKQFIDTVKLNNNQKLFSLDIVSLYTNIPTDLAKEITRKRWNEIQEHTTLPIEEFLQALELTLNSTFFQYNNTFYKQTYGCAMGSPISSTIAELVLEDLEKTIIPKIDYELPFFKRYVDDCLTAFLPEQKNTILEKFNSYHQKIQFTIEDEVDSKIDFLDLTLINNKTNILTQWHTKSTWSGRYTNFNSTHPTNQKKTVIIGLADRAIKLTSPIFRNEIIQKAKNILINNNYPKTMINKIFKSRIHKFYNSQQILKTNNTENKKFVTLPYIPQLSENISNILKQHNIQTAHKNINNLKFLYSKLKDKNPLNKTTHCIYEIPCQHCDTVYIGQTKQLLEERIKGHKYSNNITALNKHCSNTGHRFNFNNIKILNKEQNQKTRLILESIYIQKNPNACNDKTDTENLSNIYNLLI